METDYYCQSITQSSFVPIHLSHNHLVTHTHTQGKRGTGHWHFSFWVDERYRWHSGMFLSVCVLVENIEKSGLFLFVISFKIDSFSLLYISNQHINWHFPFLQFCLFDALFLHYHWSLLFLDTVIYQTFPSLHDNPFDWDSNWSGCLHCHCWYPCIICTIIGRSSSQGGQLCFSW